MPHLSPCPACQRHVRVDEARCPFCAAALPISLRTQRTPAVPDRNIGRAALFAFAAASSFAVGCDDDDPGSTAEVYGGPPAEVQQAPEPAAEIEPAPPPSNGSNTPTPLPEDDPGATGEAYGAPPPH